MKKKSIPHYINNPVLNKRFAPEKDLYRPKISWRESIVKGAIYTLITFIISYVITTIYSVLNTSMTNCFWKFFWMCEIILCLLLFRFLLIFLVKIYQAKAKSETRLRCCFVPSCSEYAILVIRRYGALIGGIKAVCRLLRCHPPGGIEFPYKIKSEKNLQPHLRKRLIKKLCFSRLPEVDEGMFPLTILSGFPHESDSTNNFEIGIIWGDMRLLRWKKIIADEHFHVLEDETDDTPWSSIKKIIIREKTFELYATGVVVKFPFEESNEDMNKIKIAIEKIVKQFLSQEHLIENGGSKQSEISKEYIDIVKKLKEEVQNEYFYN